MKTFKETFPVFTYWCGKKLALLSTFFYRKNPKKWTIKTYKRKFHFKLNLDNPSTFYEKMNYWKHNYISDKQKLFTDKILVKDYLIKAGYGNLVAKMLFSSDNVKDLKKWLNTEGKKYNAFVLKTSHSCGDVFIVKDGKITRKEGRQYKSIKKVLKILKIGLKFNHYYSRFELNYKTLKPMVYVEEYIPFGSETIEYQLMCNYGEIIFSTIVKNRQSKNRTMDFLDRDFKNLLSKDGVIIREELMPRDYDFFKEFARKHCVDFPFCRVDFIQTKDELYFCEFTFSNSGGIKQLPTKELDYKLGAMFRL